MDPTESESTTQDMHGISSRWCSSSVDDGRRLCSLSGLPVPSGHRRTTYGSVLGQCVSEHHGRQPGGQADPFQSEPGMKWLLRPPPIQLGKSGASDPRYAHSLALGGSRVLEDSLSPICVAVNSSTMKDLRWNSEGHLRSTLEGLCVSDYWHSRPLGHTRPQPWSSTSRASTLWPCLT